MKRTIFRLFATVVAMTSLDTFASGLVQKRPKVVNSEITVVGTTYGDGKFPSPSPVRAHLCSSATAFSSMKYRIILSHNIIFSHNTTTAHSIFISPQP